MRNYCLIYEYNSKLFMNLDKIIEFKKCIEEVEQRGNRIKLLFYGEVLNEELSTFMSYFNKLVGKKVCDIAISFTTKELIEENGVNNKSIKLSAQAALDIKDKKFENIINSYYQEPVEIKALDENNWERNILNIIGG